jgi:hypothetical protein
MYAVLPAAALRSEFNVLDASHIGALCRSDAAAPRSDRIRCSNFVDASAIVNA